MSSRSMWQSVPTHPYCTLMENKTLLDSQLFSYMYFVFIFFASVTITFPHDVKSNIISKTQESESDYILCRVCGADLADSKHIINQLSPEASVVVNQTLFGRKGVEIQVLKNPLGIEIDTITVLKSKCAAVHNWQSDFTWYPGYAWKPCICKQCRAHHGWLFEPVNTAILNPNTPSQRSFFALKFQTLLSENFADSLIVVPKAYRN